MNPEEHGSEDTEAPFFDPNAEIRRHWHNLPHWHQDGKFCFVTWRLADALPASVLEAWKADRDHWLAKHPPPWDPRTKQIYRQKFTERFEKLLDAGYGSCVLRTQETARIVYDALLHFDGDRYAIGSFVVMPNHVHVLFTLGQSHGIESILQSWKGYSARAINKRLERSGPLWQEDYWDRLLRSDVFLGRCLAYIESNPASAGLRENEYLYYESPGIREFLQRLGPPASTTDIE